MTQMVVVEAKRVDEASGRGNGRVLQSSEPLLEAFGAGAVFTARAPDKVTENEDAALVLPLGERDWLLGVADGVGGLPAGAHAAGIALRELARAAEEGARAGRTLREGVLTGFDRANRAVLGIGRGGACAMVVATVEAGRVRTFHAGDSGALVFGGRGRLKLQTIFHSPVGYGIEAGMLDEADAMRHEERHYVSNVVGDAEMHVAMSSAVRLRPRDTVVLASDGLFDNLYTDEIVEVLRRGSLEKSLAALATVCTERMAGPVAQRPHKPDDLTVIAFRPPRPA